MEIHFQQEQEEAEEGGGGGGSLIPIKTTTTKTTMKFKGRSRRKKSSSNNSSKYVGVRQRPSGRWVAEIKDTTQKIRMWLGTFETAEEAARAYDEAACLLRGTNTRTNFVTHHLSHDSPLASRIRILLNNKKKANQTPPPPDAANDSRITTTTIIAATPTLSSCSSSVDSVSPPRPLSEKPQQQQQHSSSNLFDDAYKPDLSNCSHEFQMGSCYDHHQSQSQSVISSWGLLEQPAAAAFDYRVVVPFNHNQEEHPKGEMEFSEFERMKVERQISASLYAMNGVHEYIETVSDPIEAFWDLPPLCSLLLC